MWYHQRGVFILEALRFCIWAADTTETGMSGGGTFQSGLVLWKYSVQLS